VLTRSVYLQQDLVRQFIEAASDQERFAAVSELVGAGRVTELQASLERAKRAWSAVTNQRQDELLPLRQRLSMIEARLSELTTRASQAELGINPEEWVQWWETLATFGLTPVRIEPASRDAPATIDNAMKQLDALRRSRERRLQALRLLQADIAGLAHQALPEIPPLRDKMVTLQKQVEELKRGVGDEQTRMAKLRRVQANLQERNDQLMALATLALKHLEDRCPVCAQTYNKEATRRRLEEIAKSGTFDVRIQSEDKLSELFSALTAKEEEAAAAEFALSSAEQMEKARQIAEQALNKRLIELELINVDEADRIATISKAVVEADSSISRIAGLQRKGESLALRLAQSSAVLAINELRLEAESLRREADDRERLIAARHQTGEQAQCVIEALREAASAVVQERLHEIGPLLQDIYARIDPHPAFRLVMFLARVVRGKGQLATVVKDPVEAKESGLPAVVLSSSQVNALAVSVFLALNIGVPKRPLSLAILDDPLQSLDDINLLGLVDLLRRTKDRRQLFVSTHDVHFGNLLSRKLRPRNEKERTIVIELDAWSRRGPTVVTYDVQSDPVPFRLVTSQGG
jgi:hypothetical protein